MAKGTVTTKHDNLNIRAEPTASSTRLGKLPPGTQFDSLDAKQDSSGVTWYKISHGGVTGWICGTYCKLDDGTTTDNSTSSSGNKKRYIINPLSGSESSNLFFDEPMKEYAGPIDKGAEVELRKSDPNGVWYLVYYSKGYEYHGTTRYEFYINQNDVQEIEPEDNEEEFKEYEALSSQKIKYFDNYNYLGSTAENDPYWAEMLEKINHAFGCPPKYNQDVDIQYNTEVDANGNATSCGIGRIMKKTFYSNPTILSICPGEVKLFPSLFGIKRDSMMDALIDVVRGANGSDSLIAKLKGDTSAFNSGQMYTFKTATANFARRVNLLCRAVASLLEIGDRPMPGTSTKLSQFDYAYWSIRKDYNPTIGDEKNHGIFTDFWNAVKDSADGAVTDKNYIHFIISNNSTNVSENISTEVQENAILGALKQTANSATATLSYFLNTGFNDTQDLSEALSEAMDSGGVGSNWTKLANNLMEGGQMVFPNQITGVNFSQALSCQVTFVSPYGDPMAVFLWCMVPIMHLMALALPKQVADNMYTFPFICKVNQKGWFNSDLAAITNLQIQRGGSDDTSWTAQGLSTEWVVSFEVAPLINSLMIPSTENPILFMKNDGLLNYLGNLCAFDLKANNFDKKKELFLQFSFNKVADFWSANNVQRHISDWLDDKIGNYFRF